MENRNLRAIILTLLTLFACHCNAEQYELVTSKDQLVAGEKYIIAHTTSSKYTFVMRNVISSDKCLDHSLGQVPTNPINLNQTQENQVAIITLQQQGEQWALYEARENMYYAPTNNNNQIKKQDAPCYYTISFSEGKVSITSSSITLKKTDNGFCFTTATSGNYLPQLYKQKKPVYQRAVTPNKLSTLCIENGVDDTSTSEAKFYSVIGVKGTEGNRTIYFGEETGALAAGQPYLFIPSRTTLSLTKNATATAVAGSHNGLIGTFTDISDDAILQGKYIANNNTIRKCGTGCTVGANRAYIDMTQVPDLDAVPSNEAEAKGVLEFGIQEDDVTGIISLDNLINKTTYTKVFNTSGQQISNNTHGIVIINGKKHVR